MSISNEIHFQASNSKVSLFTYNWAEKVITCSKITNYTLISHSTELLKYDTALLCLPVTTVGIILYINIKKNRNITHLRYFQNSFDNNHLLLTIYNIYFLLNIWNTA